MNAVLWVMTTAIPGALSTFIRCRFMSRVVGTKYPPLTIFVVAFLFDLVYGGINVRFEFATTIVTNMLYFCTGDLVLYCFLFYGSLAKKAFFIILLDCCYGSIFYTLLPIINVLLPTHPAAPDLLAYANVLLWGLVFELIGRKVHNLVYELPKGFAFYLLFVSIFIFIANVTVTELSRVASEYFSSLYLAFLSGFFAITGTLVIVLAIFTIDRELSHWLLEQGALMQLANLKEKETYWQRLASFRHDIKNNMTCLEGLMRVGKNEQALAYLDTLTDTIREFDIHISTGNAFADAIISEKMAVMADQEIAFTEDIALPETCRLEPVELCCILSNTLDNAIEACAQIKSGKRWIKAQTFTRQSQLVIVIENSIVETPQKAKSASFYPREGHGMGLLNVRGVIEKYGGAMDITTGKSFVFSAMLPLD